MQFLMIGIGLLFLLPIIGNSISSGEKQISSASTQSTLSTIEEFESTLMWDDPFSELFKLVNDVISSTMSGKSATSTDTIMMEDNLATDLLQQAADSIALTDSFEIVISYADGRTELLKAGSVSGGIILEQSGRVDVLDPINTFDFTTDSPQQIEDSISLIDKPDTIVNYKKEGLLPSANFALGAMRGAEGAGADVSTLVHQFNTAMDLLRQAEELEFDSCISYDRCLDAANRMFVSIEIDADKLSEEARKSLYEKTLISALYAIVIAFVISFGVLYIYEHYKSYQLRRFLDMEVIGSS